MTRYKPNRSERRIAARKHSNLEGNHDQGKHSEGVPRVFTLDEAQQRLGPGVSKKSLRREVNAGRLRALRVRPSINSKILIREDELLRWLEEDAAARQFMWKGVGHGSK